MVDRADVDGDLQSEIKEECQRFGTVEHCLVYILPDPRTPPEEAVRIFVKFARFEEADAAIAALNGRFFAMRQVRAAVYDQSKFDQHDLLSAPLS